MNNQTYNCPREATKPVQQNQSPPKPTPNITRRSKGRGRGEEGRGRGRGEGRRGGEYQINRAPHYSKRNALRGSRKAFNVPRTEKYFRNLIKSNRNQIVFIILRFIWNQTDTVRLLFQINRCMVNETSFRFHSIRFRKYFSVRS